MLMKKKQRCWISWRGKCELLQSDVVLMYSLFYQEKHDNIRESIKASVPSSVKISHISVLFHSSKTWKGLCVYG